MPFLSNMFGRKKREREDADPVAAMKNQYGLRQDGDSPSGATGSSQGRKPLGPGSPC